MGVETALLVGGGMAIKGGLDWWASRQQAGAARDAAQAQASAGQQARDIIAGAEEGTREDLQGGADRAMGLLGQAGAGYGNIANLIGQRGGQLTGGFQPEVDAGNQALQRLQSVLLGGDMSALQTDPGFAFRQQQGEQAMARAAAASGRLGSGGHLKDAAQYGQQLASQEYGQALNRLMGLQQIGSQAHRTQAGLGAALLGQQAGYMGQQAGVFGQQAGLQSNLGSALASLRQQTAAGQAGALTGTQQQVNQYNLAGAQAQAQGIANLGNTIQQTAMLYGLSGLGGGGGQVAPNIGQFSRPLGYQSTL
jgi:hypothetical protein